ncbi:MAG TPA: hypothetical protein VK071_04395 [Tissierellales bacterium]|nr:hypothetical protein [Tissierellales bacterium]
MNKLRQKVLKRSKGLCELCHSSYMVQVHHILGGRGRRKQQERLETLILLCWDCHHGNYGVHGKNGRELDLKLKLDLQGKYRKEGYTDDEIRELMGGKIY